MALTVGSRLGHYDVTALIGEGGMGQVYRATDTQLNRDVALKILPDAFAADPDRLARFQREAQVLASLNHPNIAQIHGIEKSDDTQALVLELVEGPTLADRIAKGPIPLDEALPIAKQIAEALEAAHEAGVIHRDLKPANIKVRDDGTVKVLDFGLAKALDTSPEGDPSQSPTLTVAATQMGVIIGTAAYMSPEQANGEPTDRRADIWSFGVVLFEMLIGRRVFEGRTVPLVLSAVLQVDPEWDRLPPTLPQPVTRLLHRCLEKNPKRRLRDIGEAAIHLEEAAAPVETAAGGRVGTSPPRHSIRTGVLGATLLVGGVLLGVAANGFWSEPAAPAARVRFTLTPSEASFFPVAGGQPDLVISPDGTRIVYQGRMAGGLRLEVRALDQPGSAPLAGSEGGTAPFFSPDGNWVGFLARGISLRRVSVLGGPSFTIHDAPVVIRGASWGPEDRIVFGGGQGLFLISSGGGDPEPLTTPDPDRNEVVHGWPSWLPGGEHILFVITSGGALEPQLAVLDLDTRTIARLEIGGTAPRYVSTGHLVYASTSGSVIAAPFDLERLRLAGNPVPLVDGVMVKNSRATNFSLSEQGHAVYVRGRSGARQDTSLVWVSRSGQEEATRAESRAYGDLNLSPDGLRVAASVFGVDRGMLSSSIEVHDLERGTFMRLSDDAPGGRRSPVWTPDGQRVAYANWGGEAGLFWTRADGTGPVERLLELPAILQPQPQAFSSDGATLVFKENTDETSQENLSLVTVGTGEVAPLLDGPYGERNATLSPSGRWLAYQSSETGSWEIYVRPFPDVARTQGVVSRNGGWAPVWGPEGRELFYLSDLGLMRVALDTEQDLDVGTEEVLFPLTPYLSGTSEIPRTFDIAPDGQRFLFQKPASIELSTRQITVVLNWTQELLERVPLP